MEASSSSASPSKAAAECRLLLFDLRHQKNCVLLSPQSDSKEYLFELTVLTTDTDSTIRQRLARRLADEKHGAVQPSDRLQLLTDTQRGVYTVTDLQHGDASSLAANITDDRHGCLLWRSAIEPEASWLQWAKIRLRWMRSWWRPSPLVAHDLPEWVPENFRDRVVSYAEIRETCDYFTADLPLPADPYPTLAADNPHKLRFQHQPTVAHVTTKSSLNPHYGSWCTTLVLHDPAVVMRQGQVLVAGAVCSIRVVDAHGVALNVCTGFRIREHGFAIMTNSHVLHDRAELCAAQFWFHYADGREPLVLQPCPDGSDRRCWRVVLPPLNRGFKLRGEGRPDLALIIFAKDSHNGRLLTQLEDEPHRLWPEVVGHWQDDTQPPLYADAEQREMLENSAAEFFMPVLGQPLSMIHASGSVDSPPVALLSLFGRLIEAGSRALASEAFEVWMHDMFSPDGSSGAPITGPSGDIVAVHFGGYEDGDHGAAVALTPAVRATIAKMLLSLPPDVQQLTERAKADISKLIRTIFAGANLFPIEELL